MHTHIHTHTHIHIFTCPDDQCLCQVGLIGNLCGEMHSHRVGLINAKQCPAEGLRNRNDNHKNKIRRFSTLPPSAEQRAPRANPLTAEGLSKHNGNHKKG